MYSPLLVAGFAELSVFHSYPGYDYARNNQKSNPWVLMAEVAEAE